MPAGRRCRQRTLESIPGRAPVASMLPPPRAAQVAPGSFRRILLAMRLTHAWLVIVDISGYTAFIHERQTSLLHAEQIITELMESVLDRATHPLNVNKLEGDAALMYAETAPGDVAAGQDVLAQVKAFFPVFASCLGKQRAERSGCGCEACSGIDKLRLKAFVHVGEMAVKQVRQFEELAGEPVIFVHRLLKNRVAQREYVLLSEAARAAAGLDPGLLEAHEEELDGVGRAQLWLCSAEGLPFELPPVAVTVAKPLERPPARGLGGLLRTWFGGR